MAAVLKTARGFAAPRGFESHALRSDQRMDALTWDYRVRLRSWFFSPCLMESRCRFSIRGRIGGRPVTGERSSSSRPGRRGGVQHALSGMADPRSPRGARYSLVGLLSVAVCAVLAGASSFTATSPGARLGFI